MNPAKLRPPCKPHTLPQARPIHRAVCIALLALGGLSAVDAPVAHAQESRTAARQQFAIPAGPVDDALGAFGAAAGVMIAADPALTEGVRSPGLRGEYDIEEGLARLLAGTPLRAVKQGPGAYILQKRPVGREGEATLAPVAVTAAGLRDGTTEGTGSYTIGVTNTAVKFNLSLRETPQSVTVMTRQRMDDQNLTTVGDVLNQTPGISYIQYGQNGAGSSGFGSRGFTVDNFQLDGVITSASALQNPSGGGISNMDSGIYDSVAVVRGATGLLSGAGTPGASVNLLRKKPTREFQAYLLGSAGTWDRYRTEVDVAGPLTQHGNIRGRLVAVYGKERSWQDRDSAKKNIFYGVLEADLSDSTLLTVGIERYENNHDNAPDGGFWLSDNANQKVRFSRSDNASARWAYNESERQTLFASLRQEFSNGWQATLSLNHTKSDSKQDKGTASWYIEPTGESLLSTQRIERSPEQNSADFYASGPFHLFGREHELMLGMNYYDISRDDTAYAWVPVPIPDIYAYDGNIARPDIPATGTSWQDNRQFGGYLATRLRPTDALSIILGTRVSNYRNKTNWDNQKETGVVTPYTGVVYDLTGQLSAYASYTSIFKPQSSQDVSGSTLAPEEGKNYELGLKGVFHDGRLNVSAAVFELRQENLAIADGIQQTPDGGQAYRAADEAKSRGYELEISGELLPGWNISGGFSQAVIRDKDGQRIEIWRPKQQFKLFTSYQLPGDLNKFTVGAGMTWQSIIYNPNLGPEKLNIHRQGSYSVTSLMARYQVSKQLELRANLDNLFDKKYLLNTWHHTYGPPRNLMLTAKYRF